MTTNYRSFLSMILRFLSHQDITLAWIYLLSRRVKAEKADARSAQNCGVRETGHLSRTDRRTHGGPEFAGGLQVDRRFDVEIIRWRSIKSRAAGRNEAEVRRGKPRQKERETESNALSRVKPRLKRRPRHRKRVSTSRLASGKTNEIAHDVANLSQS